MEADRYRQCAVTGAMPGGDEGVPCRVFETLHRWRFRPIITRQKN
jgi:hypothetical protein